MKSIKSRIATVEKKIQNHILAKEGITSEEVLFILKNRFNITFAETELKANNKLRDWVRRGIIEGPIARTGLGGRAVYSRNLPFAIKRILELNKRGMKLADVKYYNNRLIYKIKMEIEQEEILTAN